MLPCIIADRDDYRIFSTAVNVPIAEITLFSFNVQIINDGIAECDETFSLMLSVPSPPCEVVNGRNNTSIVTIRDNDGKKCK